MKQLLIIAALTAAFIAPASGQLAKFQMFRYTDPVTHEIVTRPNPPRDYTWTRTKIDDDGTWILEIGEKKPPEPPNLPTNVQVTRGQIRYRYIDPDTRKSVTSETPPNQYYWEKQREEDDGATWFLKIYVNSTKVPALPPPRPTVVETERFDTEKYCKKISDAVGGSYVIEKTCRNRERDAHLSVKLMNVPPEIERYCTRIGEAVGGSYTIMQTCVKQEIAAKAGLR